MKKVQVFQRDDVICETFVIDDFLVSTFSDAKKISKKELKILADTLGLSYTPKMLTFSKKLLTAYVKEIR